MPLKYGTNKITNIKIESYKVFGIDYSSVR